MKYFIILVLLSQNCFAKDWWIIPKIFVASRTFEYSVYNGNIKGNIRSIGGGITGIYKNFYVDLFSERNIDTNEESIIDGLRDTIEFERTDLTSTFGYAVNEFVSVFTGYKYGKSTLTELEFSPFSGAKTSLEGKGFFVGAGSGWKVKDWGIFSFSAAYAKLQASYDSFDIGFTKGDADGTSLGVKWKAAITTNLYYQLAMIRHEYYYEDFQKINFDISEQILSYHLGVSYQF
ncbi:hypothetical protein QUF74_00320 [Candidatus Halobeggiatoa sp. HSG11]|nr:hypothetical protein [Candidatus Halobeggiatoa sp. HSG11]